MGITLWISYKTSSLWVLNAQHNENMYQSYGSNTLVDKPIKSLKGKLNLIFRAFFCA